ncbi:putative Diguanylate cyclase [Beijerinckiaceae bacterium RH AL1]|nr:sensor domain-containing diguanylate cyclase [Beijerinckiaceae bacterium]VVB43346.1 putative Diguanylate cyclase [Beijerinckiaceae bacterium RH AL8]VVB43361.1 putative Diguanylate cyclase [Beijerinckiaceae bacterium RH CH11]VVC53795.1 putative Diguanylate cyclase [Beijerinckiaceae bacterium RH AL1]
MNDCIEEGERLRRLAELAIVEAPVDPLMDELCGLACGLLDMPVAFVSILDATQAHIKAHHGYAYVSAPRESTFCDVTIRNDEPLIVPDLLNDPRFAQSPFVVQAPHVRFYAGIPLAVQPGMRVGSLCVLDTKPRELSEEQVACLQSLAGLVIGQIRHHSSRQIMARQALELARRQKMLAQTAQLAGVGGFEIELESGALTASDELLRLLGAADLPTLDDLLACFEGNEDLRTSFDDLRRGSGPVDSEIEMLVADGVPRHVRIYAEVATAASGSNIVGIVQDITGRKKATDELEWLATHDTLTGVANRAAFTRHIETAFRVADETGRRLALIMLDVDRFKAINDTHGHDVGDRVLAVVAERLVSAVGNRGTVARLGGDEFGILVYPVEAESAIAAVAGDILAALREPFVFGKFEVGTHGTLGIALSSLEDTNAPSLFKEADIALYEAKKAGRDGFALFRSEMRTALDARLGRLTTTRLAAVS